jgi:hypothetical protein
LRSRRIVTAFAGNFKRNGKVTKNSFTIIKTDETWAYEYELENKRHLSQEERPTSKRFTQQDSISQK